MEAEWSGGSHFIQCLLCSSVFGNWWKAEMHVKRKHSQAEWQLTDKTPGFKGCLGKVARVQKLGGGELPVRKFALRTCFIPIVRNQIDPTFLEQYTCIQPKDGDEHNSHSVLPVSHEKERERTGGHKKNEIHDQLANSLLPLGIKTEPQKIFIASLDSFGNGKANPEEIKAKRSVKACQVLLHRLTQQDIDNMLSKKSTNCHAEFRVREHSLVSDYSSNHLLFDPLAEEQLSNDSTPILAASVKIERQSHYYQEDKIKLDGRTLLNSIGTAHHLHGQQEELIPIITCTTSVLSTSKSAAVSQNSLAEVPTNSSNLINYHECQESTFSCLLCKTVFTRASSYQLHLETAHNGGIVNAGLNLNKPGLNGYRSNGLLAIEFSSPEVELTRLAAELLDGEEDDYGMNFILPHKSNGRLDDSSISALPQPLDELDWAMNRNASTLDALLNGDVTTARCIIRREDMLCSPLSSPQEGHDAEVEECPVEEDEGSDGCDEIEIAECSPLSSQEDIHEEIGSNPEKPLSRNRIQNRKAAIRYRQKKREELSLLLVQEEQLQMMQEELRKRRDNAWARLSLVRSIVLKRIQVKRQRRQLSLSVPSKKQNSAKAKADPMFVVAPPKEKRKVRKSLLKTTSS